MVAAVTSNSVLSAAIAPTVAAAWFSVMADALSSIVATANTSAVPLRGVGVKGITVTPVVAAAS